MKMENGMIRAQGMLQLAIWRFFFNNLFFYPMIYVDALLTEDIYIYTPAYENELKFKERT